MTDPTSGAPFHVSSHADPAQFDALVESLSPAAIVAIIARSMGPRLRAVCEPEDIWQETLAAAWRDRAQHTWTSRDAYRAWVLEIARNVSQSLGTRRPPTWVRAEVWRCDAGVGTSCE